MYCIILYDKNTNINKKYDRLFFVFVIDLIGIYLLTHPLNQTQTKII